MSSVLKSHGKDSQCGRQAENLKSGEIITRAKLRGKNHLRWGILIIAPAKLTSSAIKKIASIKFPVNPAGLLACPFEFQNGITVFRAGISGQSRILDRA
jgi:hypothetical protein